jgi:hypothetical protein
MFLIVVLALALGYTIYHTYYSKSGMIGMVSQKEGFWPGWRRGPGWWPGWRGGWRGRWPGYWGYKYPYGYYPYYYY